MMTDTYIFAVNQHRLASYPHDHTYEYFQYAISMSKNNAQIILVRKDNLLHYCYVRNIGNRSFWGLCLRIGCIYKDVETLFEAFDDTFVGLAEKGVILKLDDEGEVRFVTSNFVGEAVAVREMSNHLISRLNISSDTTMPLPPVDFSISINDCIELSLEDDQGKILDSIGKYSKVYIVKTHDEIARLTELSVLIKNKNKEIQQLYGENVKLKHQKERTRIVMILCSVLAISVFVIFAFKNSSDRKTKEINRLENENKHLDSCIENLKQDSINLSNTLSSVKTELGSLINHVSFLQIDSTRMADEIYVANETKKELRRQIAAKDRTIGEKDKTIAEKDKTISELRTEISRIRSASKNAVQITSVDIATIDKKGSYGSSYDHKTLFASYYIKIRLKYRCSSSKTMLVTFNLYGLSSNALTLYSSMTESASFRSYENQLMFDKRIGDGKKKMNKGYYRLDVCIDGEVVKTQSFILSNR